MKRSLLFVLLAALAGFLVVQWLHSEGWLEQVEQAGNDWRFRRVNATWHPHASQPDHNDQWVSNQNACKVVIVALDERVAAWPLPAEHWHRLLNRLRIWGVAAVGIDAPLDDATIAALEAEQPQTADGRAISVHWPGQLPVLVAQHPHQQAQPRQSAAAAAGTAANAADGEPSRPGPSPLRVADATLTADRDDVVRSIPLRHGSGSGAGTASECFALQLAHLVPGTHAEQWREYDRAALAYVGPPGAIPRISLADVLDGRVPADTLRRYGVRDAGHLLGGRVVLIGSTWPGQHVGPAGAEAVWGVRTPYYDSPQARAFRATRDGLDATAIPATWTRMPSVEVQANAVQMFTQAPADAAIRVASPERNGAVLIAACLLMVLVVALLPPLFSFLALVALAAGLYLGTSALLVEQRTFYSVLGPTIGASITFVFGTIASYVVERRERRYITEMFSKYLSPQVVRQMAASKEPPKLGGESRELTLLFSDLAGFTSWSERLGPERLLELLNEYLGAMTEVIFKHHGTLDKFMGDAVMAFWNAPVAKKDHEMKACEAALAMIDRLDELNRAWQATGLNPLRMRIGLHTGPAVVGNAGSGERFDYTAFGDSVNLASRLEGTAKRYGVSCVISSATFDGAGGSNRLMVRHLDRVRVVGRKQPVDIYELIGTAKEAKDARNSDFLRFVESYDLGLTAYLARDWSLAVKALREAQALRPRDTATKILLARIQRFIKQPPSEHWDGSVELPTK